MSEDNATPAPEEQRGLATDLAVHAVEGLSVGLGTVAGAKILGGVLDRPPKPEPPKIELPPGVDPE